jgi:hypothetical protein
MACDELKHIFSLFFFFFSHLLGFFIPLRPHHHRGTATILIPLYQKEKTFENV